MAARGGSIDGPGPVVAGGMLRDLGEAERLSTENVSLTKNLEGCESRVEAESKRCEAVETSNSTYPSPVSALNFSAPS